MSLYEHSSHSDGSHAAGHSPEEEIVAQRVRCGRLDDPGALDRALEMTLERAFERMVAPPHTAARIERDLRMRKDPEPAPRRAGPRVLAIERIGHVHAAVARIAIVGPHRPCARHLLAQGRCERRRQHHDPVLEAFALAHDQRLALEVDIFHAQPNPLHDAHAGAVEQLRQQPVRCCVERHQHTADLVVREHDR